jgi:hypothetical protein
VLAFGVLTATVVADDGDGLLVQGKLALAGFGFRLAWPGVRAELDDLPPDGGAGAVQVAGPAQATGFTAPGPRKAIR